MSSTVDKIYEVDRRLLGLRADYLACTTLVQACDEAIERLTAFSEVASGRTRVPSLALSRLRNVRDDWSLAGDELSRQMADAVKGLVTQSVASRTKSIAS
jgi:hypothetical protein